MKLLTCSPPAPPSRDQASPGELVERASRCDETAWRGLVERFSGLVWSITRAHGLSATDAADVSQTVWLRLVDNLSRLRDPEKVGAWLAATTRHECVRAAKVRRRTMPIRDMETVDGPEMVVDEDPSATLARRGTDAAIREILATMPHRARALLGMLTADPPVPYVEIAAGLGMSVGSIGPTRQRCLRVLRAKCVSAGIQL